MDSKKKKSGRWRRPNGGAKKPSFVKIGIQEKIKEARRSAHSGTSCTCKNDQCTHGDPTWLGRAEKLGALRGEMAVAVFNLRSKPNFWDVVDALKPAPVKPKSTRPSVPKSSPGVSLKSVLRKLQRKAKEKSVNGNCACPPWQDCSHVQGELREVWAIRLKKLKCVSIEDAKTLLPHVGASGIWDAVDGLDLADQVGSTKRIPVTSPPKLALEPSSPVTEQTDRGFVW